MKNKQERARSQDWKNVFYLHGSGKSNQNEGVQFKLDRERYPTLHATCGSRGRRNLHDAVAKQVMGEISKIASAVIDSSCRSSVNDNCQASQRCKESDCNAQDDGVHEAIKEAHGVDTEQKSNEENPEGLKRKCIEDDASTWLRRRIRGKQAHSRGSGIPMGASASNGFNDSCLNAKFASKGTNDVSGVRQGDDTIKGREEETIGSDGFGEAGEPGARGVPVSGSPRGACCIVADGGALPCTGGGSGRRHLIYPQMVLMELWLLMEELQVVLILMLCRYMEGS